MRETGGLELASTITLVLQVNQLTKCASFAKISQNSQKNTFNIVAGLIHATLTKNRLCHRCFPVSFAKFLRTSPDNYF